MVPKLEDSQTSDGMTSQVNLKTNVTFVSPRLLAIDLVSDYYYAGAAHPDAGTSSVVYDLKLGQPIAISTGQPADKDGIITQSPAFKTLIVEKMLAQSKKLGADEECAEVYTADQLGNYPNVSVSPRAITVSPAFPHVIAACDFDTVIPLEQFAPVAKKGSLLEELVLGAKRLKK